MMKNYSATSLTDNMYLRLIFTIFAVFALFDAIFGGAISALLQIDGWTPLDQRINNVYQAIYGVLIALGLAWFWVTAKSGRGIFAILILFLGYVEDTLFYLLQPIVKPVISFLTSGAVFNSPDGPLHLFPDRISGYLGWFGRVFLGHNISLSTRTVFIINISAVLIVLAVLVTRNRTLRNKADEL